MSPVVGWIEIFLLSGVVPVAGKSPSGNAPFHQGSFVCEMPCGYSCSMIFSDSSCRWQFILPLILLLTLVIYWPGLSGNFDFDDSVHITGNELIKITDLSTDQLYQAWNSSPFDFPGSRPLSMLTFGLNHYVSGMDPFSFKLTNLFIHLASGVAIFFFVQVLLRSYFLLKETAVENSRLVTIALLVCALWLWAPINLSSVLYVVQRMTSLSSLFIILALISYVLARQSLTAEVQRPGLFLLVALFSVMAFLAKEIAALVPLYLLVIELTIFRFAVSGRKGRFVLYAVVSVMIVLPVLAGGIYVYSHPERFIDGYASRPFTLEERLLSQPRIVWFYIQQVFFPNLAQLAFHHDGFPLSRALGMPWTTLPALAGILLLVLIGILFRKRQPILAFGILFFIAGHALESTFIPLEPVFEHRNYLPAFGLLLILGFYLVKLFDSIRMKVLVVTLTLVVVGFSAGMTALRAAEWGDFERFVVVEANRHPGSVRSNFKAGRLFVGKVSRAEDSANSYELARKYFEQVVETNPQNSDGLFGLIVLNLHVGLPPEEEWLEKLEHRLREHPFSPLNVTTSQFSYLVRWNMGSGFPLSHVELVRIFNAALDNKQMDGYARAGITNAYRAYYQELQRDNNKALTYAEIAVKHHPGEWHYHKRLIQLLVEMDHSDAARRQLAVWESLDKKGLFRGEVEALRSRLNDDRE